VRQKQTRVVLDTPYPEGINDKVSLYLGRMLKNFKFLYTTWIASDSALVPFIEF
jgi:hypothetical protein